MIKVEIIPESLILKKMDDEEYFALEGFVSNSKLKLINPDEDGSKEKYLEGFTGGFNESFEVGSAVHGTCLIPDEIIISNITKPSGKLGLFIEKMVESRNKGLSIYKSIERASDKADYYKGKLSEKIRKTAFKKGIKYYFDKKDDPKSLFLSEANLYKYQECCKSLEKFKHVINPTGLLEDPESCNEYAIFCDIRVTFENGKEVIVKFKGKLDNYTIDWEGNVLTLNDLKTTGKAVNFFMGNDAVLIDDEGKQFTKWIDGSFQKFHYDRQMGVYLLLLQCYYKTQGYIFNKYKANMLVVETIPNFKAKLYPVSNRQIKNGVDEFKRLIIEVAKLEL